MVQQLYSTLVQDHAVAADGIETFDLSVNPLSVINLVIRPLNETSTFGNFARYLAICGAFNNIRVLHQGASVFSMTGRDAAALGYFRHGIMWPSANDDDADNERRAVVLPILFGRFPYDIKSCFPASRRGELQLEVDIDVSSSGYDGFRFSVDTIELLDVKPNHFERKTTLSATWGATGINDLDLPIGNVVRGLLGFGTTGFAGATPVPSLGSSEIQLDNQQIAYNNIDFEVAHGMGALMGRQPPRFDAHTHRVDATAANTTEETTGPIEVGSDGWQNYMWLDFDVNRDDMFSIDTKSAASFRIRVNAETADAVRFIPIERIMV